ncbi:MAG: tetratricopeptide repeat protein, partial [Alphaproteobacteria bacterium]|nr:tetratricopeptide repeat protein [Alphaproteobacteria bacterium]
RPAAVEPRRLLADALASAGKLDAAIDVLSQTARDFVGDPEILNRKGSLERSRGDLAAAEASFSAAAALRPNDPEILNNLGVVARARGRTKEAVALYRRALEAGPPTAIVLGNLGNVLDDIGDYDAAELHLRAARDRDPQSVDARYNLAAHLTRRHRPDESVPDLRELVIQAPDRWDAWINLGIAELALNNLAAAESAMRQALAIKPDNPEARYNLAWLLLLTGRWHEGWVAFEARWNLPRFASRRPAIGAPEWDGRPLGEGTLLIYAEQGFGDAIQMIRLTGMARARCGRLVVECPTPLRRLMTRAPNVDAVVANPGEAGAVLAQVAMMSLPRVLAITPDLVPSTAGYLTASPRTEALSLDATGRPRIGIAWAGSPDNRIDAIRTCDAAHFARLLENLDVDIVNLQIGPRAGDYAAAGGRAFSWSCAGNVSDFDDTATVVGQLDLVITVDTAVAHLAGALGKPTWMLLPFSPDYRWMLERADTPWYASVRLFRQRQRGDWNQVFADVARALTTWLSSHR